MYVVALLAIIWQSTQVCGCRRRHLSCLMRMFQHHHPPPLIRVSYSIAVPATTTTFLSHIAFDEGVSASSYVCPVVRRLVGS